MKGFILHAAVATASALVLTAWTQSSRAEETLRSQQIQGSELSRLPPPVMVTPARDVVTTEEKVPNAGLIASGAVMFSLPYATSVIVGASSTREGDRYLYVPVAGPWIDIAKRGPCRGAGCEREMGNNVLLVANGVLQGVGALQILGGFIFPTTRTVTRTASVHVTPTGGPSSLGLAAFGAF
jgi:hypothetical protein